jgi:hypothetical protein
MLLMSQSLPKPYPYSEATADFMDMAGQVRPSKLVIPIEGSDRHPAPGDLGTLQGLQNAVNQVTARIRDPVLRLRLSLLLEEVLELSDACLQEDIEMIARNVADILYIAFSFPHSLGYDGTAVYDAVHRANMTKKMGKFRSDGKQLAPADFNPPNIKKILLGGHES